MDCDGDVEIGIGRIPAVDVEDADAAVRKIKRYIETSGYGNEMWRTSMMFVADDGARDYARTCDYMERNIDTLCPAMNIDKLYEDSYVRQKHLPDIYILRLLPTCWKVSRMVNL